MMNDSSIGALLARTIERLHAAGIATARLDAEVLLAHALGCDRTAALLRRREHLDPATRARFEAMVDARASRAPVAHIIGSKPFWSLDIAVNEPVLTPRPETEGIVERALAIFPRDADMAILDLCTGSGCIAAALAVEFPRAHIVATDISTRALDVARTNLAFAADRIELLCGDLFDVFASCAPNRGPRQFDLVVANPPYIPDADIAETEPEVGRHEPRIALAGGCDGLAILGKIIKYAPRYIRAGGSLILEIGIGQARAMRELLEAEGSYATVSIDKDLAGIERIVAARQDRNR